MMTEHSERQFVGYSSHTFQAPETFITRNAPRLTPYPRGSYIPPSDDQILEMVVRTITENRTQSQSTDNDTGRVGSPVIEGRGHPSAEDIPERVDSPVVPCSSTVDGGRHEEGGSKEDGENAPLFRNNDTDYHTNSRPDKHSSEMGKEGTWSIKPAAEELGEEEEDLYCMTEFDVPRASQRGNPGLATPSPDILSSVQMIVLPDEVALKLSCLQKGRSDIQYEDVTDDEQMDMKPQKRGESLLEPSCKMDILVETDDGFVCQPCAACVRRKELEMDTIYGISEMQDEQGELIVDESPPVSADERETEDEEDDDWTVIGPMGILSLKYIPPDVCSKSAPASSRLEVFDNMECFKEAKAKQLGIAPDHMHGVEVNKSNAGTAAPIAPARSRRPFGEPPQRSPQHSAEKSSYLMPLSPLSIVTAMEHSSDSSNDSDLLERNGFRRKRRKLSKSKNMVPDYSKSKAESDQDHNKPADCQKRGLISSEIESGPCTPQSNSSETENSSDCSMSPPQRNRLTPLTNQCWNERSNSPLISHKRSISNSESGVHGNGDAASSPLRRSISHEPESERRKVKTTILKTLLSTQNDTEKKQAKNRDDKEYGSGGRCPEPAASRLDKSREASLSRQCSSESTVNSVRAREKHSNSRQSPAVTKANLFKPREGLPASKEGPSAFSIPGTGIKEKLKNEVNRMYLPGGTSVEMDEEKSSTMSRPGPPQHGGTFRQTPTSQEPAPGKRRNSHRAAPGQRRISHESSSGQRRIPYEPAPRQRHKSHENPLLKKIIAEARSETKRKATKVPQNEQSGSKVGSKGMYKWKEKEDGRESPVDLDWEHKEYDD